MAGGDDSAGSEGVSAGKGCCPVPRHPFFMPVSAKRAHSNASPICVDTIDLSVPEAQPKRLKQKDDASQASAEKRGRVGRPRGSGMQQGSSGSTGCGSLKTSKIQSFFTVRSSQPSNAVPPAQPPPPEARPELVCTVVELVDAAAQPESTKAESESTKAEPEAPAQRRPLFRAAGISAPLPTEHTHVPFPTYRAFGEVSSTCRAGRYSAEAINGAAQRAAERAMMLHPAREWCPPTDGESADGGCAQWRRSMDSNSNTPLWRRLNRHSPDAVMTQSADRARIRTTPARVLLGRHLPPAPAHLQFTEPLLHLLCSQGHAIQDHQPSQLLSSRYRPRRARDVLDNQRVVSQLHSWIESMRLKRPALQASAEPRSRDEFCASQGPRKQGYAGHRPPPPKAANFWRTKPRRTVGDDSASGTEQSSQPASEGDSSDDFVPQTRRRTGRRANRADGLGDVMAWTQSNGTLSSARERAYLPARHQRHGSSGGSGSGSESESFSNVILLAGPSGSCKTAAVYACAEESGYEVHEIHPGQRRSGKDVLALLEDVILSHTITAQAGNPSLASNGTVNQMLILIEQVDILFEQDQRLWPALKQLALKSRRPIVLTCSDLACVRWDTSSFHAVLHFARPSERSLVPYCFLLCLAEGVLAAPTDLARACRESERDINRLLCLLDVAVMQTSVIEVADTSERLTATAEERQTLDLGGTLAWLFSPLDAGETPQSRYSFWSELVSSVHPEDSQSWFSLWPDPPPLLYDEKPAVAKPRLLSLHQDDLFTQPASKAVGTPELCAETEQLALSSSPHNNAPILRVSALVTAAKPAPLAYTISSISTEAPVAVEHDQLDDIAYALDTLSLARATTSATELRTECFLEPLYTHLAPLNDGCLDVSYITLDSDILTRRNVTLLLDSASASQSTEAAVDAYLRASAMAQLGSVGGIESMCHGIDNSMKIRGLARPLLSSVQPTESSIFQHRLQRAFELTDARSRRCTQSVLLETVSYLTQMIAWDHVHQGKAGSMLPSLGSSDGAEHAYRTGTRRTRLNTYRPHIKNVPDPVQAFLLSWVNLGKQPNYHI
ncbi:hypothetical protein GGF42_005724 [Coemansia sp. RSA 2424]|nr:hypothetical protein GGF42_005724 [Coemansia sp. RSA 2424]